MLKCTIERIIGIVNLSTCAIAYPSYMKGTVGSRLIERSCKLASFGHKAGKQALWLLLTLSKAAAAKQHLFRQLAGKLIKVKRSKFSTICMLQIAAGKDKGEKLFAHDLHI